MQRINQQCQKKKSKPCNINSYSSYGINSSEKKLQKYPTSYFFVIKKKKMLFHHHTFIMQMLFAKIATKAWILIVGSFQDNTHVLQCVGTEILGLTKKKANITYDAIERSNRIPTLSSDYPWYRGVDLCFILYPSNRVNHCSNNWSSLNFLFGEKI